MLEFHLWLILPSCIGDCFCYHNTPPKVKRQKLDKQRVPQKSAKCSAFWPAVFASPRPLPSSASTSVHLTSSVYFASRRHNLLAWTVFALQWLLKELQWRKPWQVLSQRGPERTIWTWKTTTAHWYHSPRLSCRRWWRWLRLRMRKAKETRPGKSALLACNAK